MAIGHLTYLDLTPEQRQAAAAKVREQIRLAKANPFLTREQLKILADRIDFIAKWEAGDTLNRML